MGRMTRTLSTAYAVNAEITPQKVTFLARLSNPRPIDCFDRPLLRSCKTPATLNQLVMQQSVHNAPFGFAYDRRDFNILMTVVHSLDPQDHTVPIVVCDTWLQRSRLSPRRIPCSRS